MPTDIITLPKVSRSFPRYPVTLFYRRGCIAVPAAQADVVRAMMLPGSYDAREERFELNHVGPWQTLTHLGGWAVTPIYGRPGRYSQREVVAYTFHGRRTLQNPRGSGYGMEGSVSLGGVRHRAFTSSILLEFPGDVLVSAAVLYVCVGQRL